MIANRQIAVAACGREGWQVRTISTEGGILAHPLTDYPIARNLNGPEPLASMTLKARYQQYFHERRDNTVMLKAVVKDLIDEGVPRQTMVTWAVEAGYSKRYVWSLLSRILVSLGVRARKQGGGRKPSLDALDLLDYAHKRYGKEFLKVLRGALWAGKAQQAAAECPNGTPSRPSGLIVTHNNEANQTDYTET